MCPFIWIPQLSTVCHVCFFSLSQYSHVCFCTSQEVAATQTLTPKGLRAHLQGKKTFSHTTSVLCVLLRKSTVSASGHSVASPAVPTSLLGLNSRSRTQARHCELPWVPRLFSLFVRNHLFTCHGLGLVKCPGQLSCRISCSLGASHYSLMLRRRSNLSGRRTPWITSPRGINPGARDVRVFHEGEAGVIRDDHLLIVYFYCV